MAGSLSIPNTFASQSGNVPASQLDTNYTTIRDYVNNREVGVGTLAARPAASIAGRWYLATDTGTVYVDTGSAWVAAPGPSGGGFNYTANGDMRAWGNGTAARPTSWARTGAGSTAARNTTNFKTGNASADLVRSGTDCFFSQDIDTIPGFDPVGWWKNRTVTAGYWIRATVASRARGFISDGVGSTFTAYHSGGSTFEFLTVTRTIDNAATKVQVGMQVDTGNTTAQMDSVVLVEGSYVSDFIPSGWRGRKSTLQFGTAPGVTVGAGANVLLGARGISAGGAGDSLAYVPFQGGTVFRNMYVAATAAPGVGQTFTYTLDFGGVDQTLTVQLAGGAATLGSDLTHEAFLGAGGNIEVRLVTSAGAAVTTHAIAFEIEEVPLS